MERKKATKPARQLEEAVRHDSIEEILRIKSENKRLRFNAISLGAACRFRGIEIVRTLVENGAKFDKSDQDYSVALLDNFPSKKIGYGYWGYYSRFYDMQCGEGPLPYEQRLEVLDYLIENRETVRFEPDKLLFNTIIYNETVMYDELKKRGITFSKSLIKKISNEDCDGRISHLDEYNIWIDALLRLLYQDDLEVFLKRTTDEMGGEKIQCCAFFAEAAENTMFTAEKLEKICKILSIRGKVIDEFLKSSIDKGNTECIDFAVEKGWLRERERRNEIIEYAQQSGNTELTAFLLDYKNRTADIKAELAYEEKRQNALLNGENSIEIMKELWDWEKLEDGSIVLTGYKGDSTEVIVPKNIGRRAVTALKGTFDAYAKNITHGASHVREHITKITLPETITEIGKKAFNGCSDLESVNIPKSTVKIGEKSFRMCNKLIGVEILDGVSEIERYAFSECFCLTYVIVPESVKTMGECVFANSKNAWAIVKRHSYAEKYCRENDIRYSDRKLWKNL